MQPVKRYDLESASSIRPVETESGGWVRWEDHEAAVQGATGLGSMQPVIEPESCVTQDESESCVYCTHCGNDWTGGGLCDDCAAYFVDSPDERDGCE